MSNSNLPPLPPIGAVGPEVCSVVQLYLAVWDDITPDQRRVLAKHLEVCADCAQEARLLKHAAYLVASLDASSPSARVDQAVMAIIAARGRSRHEQLSQPVQAVKPPQPVRRKRKTPVFLGGLIAAAAVLLLALLSTMHVIPFLSGGPQQVQAFSLPANLSWSAYVLHQTQTRTSAQGQHYQIETYQNLATGQMNVRTVMDDKLEVVAVSDEHKVLGMDMMHHVAQWGADNWMVDGSLFDLARLRRDLQSKQAVFDGKGTFNEQEVYRIRYPDGHVLLLDMQYMPVNVLQNASNTGSARPLYDTCEMLPASKVPESTWDMNVPKGFKMGSLPAKP